MASKKDELIENSFDKDSQETLKFGEFITIEAAKFALQQKPLTLEQLVLSHLKSKLD